MLFWLNSTALPILQTRPNQAKAIKQSVSIPVMVTGGIKTAEELLQNHYADLIGVGRAVLHDSNWAKNAVSFSV